MKKFLNLVLVVSILIAGFPAVKAKVFTDSELKYKEIKFKLDDDFLVGQTFDEIAENLKGYVDDINKIYAKSTKRRFTFDPNRGGLEFFDSLPLSSGACTTPDTNHSYTLYITKRIGTSSSSGSYRCDFLAENTLNIYGAQWVKVYSRKDIQNNTINPRSDYFLRQLNLTIHELGHLHGLGAGEYSSLASKADRTGTNPSLDISSQNPASNFYWSKRTNVLSDPMFKGVGNNLTEYLANANFSDLSSKLINDISGLETINSGYPNLFSISREFINGQSVKREFDINIKVLDFDGNAALVGCVVDVYKAISGSSSQIKIYSGTTNALGGYSFKNQIIHSSSNIFNMIKVYCDGYEPAGDALSAFDLQAYLYNNGGTLGDFHYDGVLEIYARRKSIPSVVTIVAPLDKAQLATSKPLIKWNPVNAAVSYNIRITTSAGSTVVNDLVTATSYTPIIDLLDGETYTLTISATNELGTGPASIVNFTVAIAPSVVTDIKINSKTADAAVVDNVTLPRISWTGAARATGYDLVIKDASGTAIVTKNDNLTTSFNLSNALAVGNYSLTITAFLQTGTSPKMYGKETTIKFSVIAKPASFIINTLAGLDTLRPSFSWGESAGATSYKVEIIKSNLVVYSLASTTSTSLNLDSDLLDGSYTIRVTASNAAGSTSASKTFQIVTTPGAVTNIKINSKVADNAVISSTLTPSITWTGPANATGYDLVIKDASAAAIVTQNDILTTSFNLTSPLVVGNYSLVITPFLQTSTGSKISGTASIVKFSVMASPASFVINTSTVLNTKRPSFSWTASAGATSYKVEITKSGILVYSLASTTSTSLSLDSDLPDGGYTIRVTASNAAGNTTVSKSFQIVTTLGAVTNIKISGKVADNAVISSTLIPSITWTGVTNATEYDLVIKDASGAALVTQNNNLTTSFNLSNPLAVGSYSLVITPFIRTGTDSRISGAASTVNFSVMARPGNFTINTPTGLNTKRPSFSWGGSVGATSYKIEITSSNVLVYSLASTTSTSLSLDSDLADGAYTIRVTATNAAGITSASKAFQIVTNLAGVTNIRISGKVADNAVISSTLIPSITWTAVTNAIGYDLMIKDASNTAVVTQNDILTTSFNLSSALAVGNYSLVLTPFTQTSTGSKISGTATTVKFSVIARPGNFTINTPTGLNTKRPSFSWGGSAGATSYKVEITKSGILVYSLASTTSTSLSLDSDLADANYSIRVTASNAAGITSASKTFQIVTPPAAVTNLVVSFDNVAGIFTASWTGVANATTYEISVDNLISGEKALSSTILAPNTTGLTSALSSSSGGGQYKAKVIARNSGTVNSEASIFNQVFFFNSPITSIPGITAPSLDQVLTSESSFTFKWDHAIGAAGYRVRIEEDSSGTLITDFNNARVDALSYAATLPTLATGTYRFTVIPIDGSGVDVLTSKHSRTFKI